MELLAPFLEASVRLAAPLAMAALGETLSERAGVINIGLEGSIIAGALGGALGALVAGDPYLGVLAGILAGVLLAALFGWVAVGMGADQIIAGTAVTLAGLGLTGIVYQEVFGTTGTALTLPTLSAWRIPLLSDIPVVGPALFNQAPTVYATALLVPVTWWALFRTGWGLTVRAVGEAPDAADAAGVRVKRVRWVTVLIAGGLAGMAGAHLALAHTGTFAEGMSAGRGFIAIAIVALGRWNPAWVAGAALFFGAASALQFTLQSLGTGIPYPVFLALPYVLTLLALAGGVGRSRAPRALARPWPPEHAA